MLEDERKKETAFSRMLRNLGSALRRAAEKQPSVLAINKKEGEKN